MDASAPEPERPDELVVGEVEWKQQVLYSGLAAVVAFGLGISQSEVRKLKFRRVENLRGGFEGELHIEDPMPATPRSEFPAGGDMMLKNP